MDISITDDNKYLILKNLNEFELETVQTFFTKKPENSWVIEKKNPYYQTEMNFLNKFGMLPIGLWLELVKYAQKHNVFLNFDPRINDVIQDTQLNYNVFEYFAQNLFANALDKNGDKVSPRTYQLEGVFKLLKFKKACVEVTTSGGKTLMAYMLFKFLWDVKHIKRCLYIVPNKNLATQSYDKFNSYENWVKGPHNYKPAYMFSGMKKSEIKAAENCDVLFATYQTLNNKDDKFFEQFDLIITDECLHPTTKIKMADGSEKEIKDVKVGDKVWTINEQTGEQEILPVKEVYKNLSKNQQMFEIEMENGEVLKITGNHKVYTSNRGYVRADELTEDDDIVSFS